MYTYNFIVHIELLKYTFIVMEASDIKKIVGINLKKARTNCNLTQFELAERIGMTQKQIASIELGQAYPEASTLAKLADMLSVPLSFFFRNGTETEAENRRVMDIMQKLHSRIDSVMNEEAAEYGPGKEE